jgi:opacity protein-like surface antigen
LTLNSWRFFGHEFGYAYNRTHLRFESLNPTEQGMGIHQGFYDFLAYATPEGSFFRPFATGGVQFNNYVPPGSSAAQGGGQTKFGANYGAGVKFKVLSNIGLRFDIRQYINGKPFNLGGSGAIRMLEVSAGVGFLL